MKITLAEIVSKDACNDQVKTFRKLFGESAKINLSNIKKAYKAGLSIDWYGCNFIPGYKAKIKLLFDDYDAKRKPLDDDYKAKRKPLDDDYKAKRKLLDDDYKAKIKLLYDDYEAKIKLLYDDYEAKRKLLYDDYKAKIKPLDDDLNLSRVKLIVSLIPGGERASTTDGE
jgi:hypothetical protein